VPDFFHIDFDSTAPEITWGAVSGVGRNRILIARYTVDEPGVAAAQFIDADDVTTDLTVYGDRLVGRIPASVAYGQGVIRAWLQDDVGNTAVRSQYVTLAAPTIHIDLDTTPPVVTWGPVDGTEPGDDFTVQYLLDEPDLISAELELLDSRVLPMQVFPDTLRVSLPMDIPEGPATVRAFVRDEVGNEAYRTLVVLLSGTLPPPPTVSPFQGGGLPRRRIIVKPRHVTSSRSAVRARAAADTTEATLAVDPVRVTTRIHYARAGQIVRLLSHGTIRTGADQVAAITADPTVAIASAHFSLAKRTEGPQAEAELLLLLDLL
jgi:hypothetical protein